MVTIRKFQLADAPAVSALIRTTMERSNSQDYSLEQLRPLMNYFDAEKIEQLNMDRKCLVASEQEQVVGTIAVEDDRLCTFFVYTDYQSRGIGTRLLKEMEIVARQLGIKRLTAEASLTGTTFYERHGYCRTGRTIDGVAGSQIEVAKTLAECS